MKKTTLRIIALLIAAAMLFVMTSCGNKNAAEADPDHEIVLNIFASNNSVLAVSALVDSYKSMSSYASVRITYDEPAMLAAKIEAGYECDIFICEDEACMDWLDKSKKEEVNPNNNDCIDSDTRAKVFKGVPDESDVEYTFEAAMVKSTKEEREVKKFLDFIVSQQSDKAYENAGFEKLK